MKKLFKLSQNSISFIILVIFLVASWLLGKYLHIDAEYLRNSFSKSPPVLSSLIFIFIYVIAGIFLWPTKDTLKVLGALIFGAILSSLLILVSELANATILFNLSRKLGRNFVKDSLKGVSSNLDEWLSRYGFWGVFCLRIVPLVPFRITDILAGLTKISFREYLLAVVLGSPLRIFWLQSILGVVGEAIFKDPKVLAIYFLEHRAIFVLSLIYLVAAILLAILFRKKYNLLRKNGS